MCLAKDVMTPNPTVCREEHTIYDAVRVMNREDCGVVPVVDDEERCIGIITDRDICLRLVLEHLDPEDTPVSEMMTANVVACQESDDMRQVIELMRNEQIRRIPVLNENEHLVGIISEGDIAKSDARDLLCDLVEAVVK